MIQLGEYLINENVEQLANEIIKGTFIYSIIPEEFNPLLFSTLYSKSLRDNYYTKVTKPNTIAFHYTSPIGIKGEIVEIKYPLFTAKNLEGLYLAPDSMDLKSNTSDFIRSQITLFEIFRNASETHLSEYTSGSIRYEVIIDFKETSMSPLMVNIYIKN